MPFYAGERVGVQFDDGLYTAQIVTVHPTGDVDVVYDFDSSIGIFINASLLRHLPKDGVLMSGGSSGSSSFRRAVFVAAAAGGSAVPPLLPEHLREDGWGMQPTVWAGSAAPPIDDWEGIGAAAAPNTGLPLRPPKVHDVKRHVGSSAAPAPASLFLPAPPSLLLSEDNHNAHPHPHPPLLLVTTDPYQGSAVETMPGGGGRFSSVHAPITQQQKQQRSHKKINIATPASTTTTTTTTPPLTTTTKKVSEKGFPLCQAVGCFVKAHRQGFCGKHGTLKVCSFPAGCTSLAKAR
eukprot:gene15325-35546_t